MPPLTNVTEAGTVDESDATVVFESTTAEEANYLRLVAGSPAVNAGNDDYLNNGTPDDTGDDIKTDAVGNARIQGRRVDLGAYESAFDPPAMQRITFASPAVGGVVGNTIDLTAVTNAPGLFVTFSIDPPNGVATLLDDGVGDGMGMLRFDAEGEVMVTALQGGGDSGGVTYPPATSVTHTITVRPETAAIFRVTTTGAGNRSGSSWGNAMTLQTALGRAIVAGDQIWIAEGTYKPHADDRTATFSISAGALVYGGFAGSEIALADRAGGATILSGDLADNDLTDREDANYTLRRTENSYTVVTVGGANVTLDGLTIEGGERGTVVRTNYHGAGLYAGAGTTGITLTACTFNNNNADDSGGGAYFTESATLTDGTFNNNNAINDGGGAFFNGTTATLTNCIFADNNAIDDGGGAYFNREATVKGCDFNDNNSDYWGGGAVFRGPATVTNSTFTANTANGVSSEGGGAIFFETATVTQCTFTNNETTNDGGGAYFDIVGTVINSTLYNNTAHNRGGGIFVRFDVNNPFPLQNSILMGNTAADAASGHQVYVNNTSAANVVNIQHNLIEGGADPAGTDQGVVYVTPGSGNITEAGTVDESDATVVFASIMAANEKYLRLATGSPAVNAGNNDYLNNGTPGNTADDITTDLAGETRIQGGTVDLGAYEGAFVPPTAQTLAFTDPADDVIGTVGDDIALEATTDALGLFVSFEIDNPAVATLTDDGIGDGIGSLHLDAPGTVTVTARQAGGDGTGGITYSAATSVMHTITVRPAGPAIFRVAETAAGTENGLSWANAITLQTALAISAAGDQLWLRQGTYMPITPANAVPTNKERNTPFVIPEGVAVYGGFVGTEAADFDPATNDTRAYNADGTFTNETILSGDLLSNDEDRPVPEADAAVYDASRGDNSYTVVMLKSPDIKLNGLTITAGVRGTAPSPFLRHSTGVDFAGGGLHANAFATNTVLVACTFTNNNADDIGGGIYFEDAVTLTTCTFRENSTLDIVVGSGGGAYFNDVATLTGCTFDDNASEYGAGAAFDEEATVMNCIFVNNRGGGGAAFGG